MRLAPLLCTLLLLAGAVAAHGPPAPRGHEAYLLVDHNDDCEQDARCPGHDLVALYVSESHDPALGDLVDLRLILLGRAHGTGTLRDVVTLTANGQAKTFELSTSDHQAFTGTGCDRVTRSIASTPSGSPDGDRIVVQCSVKLATLGGVGARLEAYKVESFRGATKGDYMPGGYWNDVGLQVADPAQGDAVTNRAAPGYTLRGPGYHATVGLPDLATVRADGESVAEVTVTNALRSVDWDMAQVVTLSVSGADGFTATWVGGLGSDPTKVELDVPEGASRRAELRLRGDGHAPTTGTLTITLTSSTGGHAVHDLPYEILPASADTGGETTSSAPGSKDAPAPAAALLALALLALAAARRQA